MPRVSLLPSERGGGGLVMAMASLTPGRTSSSSQEWGAPCRASAPFCPRRCRMFAGQDKTGMCSQIWSSPSLLFTSQAGPALAEWAWQPAPGASGGKSLNLG